MANMLTVGMVSPKTSIITNGYDKAAQSDPRETNPDKTNTTTNTPVQTSAAQGFSPIPESRKHGENMTCQRSDSQYQLVVHVLL